MNQKRYWLRGLTAGVVIYAVGLLTVYLTEGAEFYGLATMIVAVYFSPVIVIGLIIGAIYGKTMSKVGV